MLEEEKKHSSWERWDKKKLYYQDKDIVANYDKRRFQKKFGKDTTGRKWKMILEAFGEHFEDVEDILDVPCGTGRFTRQLLQTGKRLTNGDISLEMLREAHKKALQEQTNFNKSAAFEAEYLPFADKSFDAVISIRFLFHVPRPLRPRILAEFARVSRRWVVLDVRHRYCINTHLKRFRSFLKRKQPPRKRYLLSELENDIQAGNLKIRRKIWNYPPFSEKLVLLCERSDFKLDV